MKNIRIGRFSTDKNVVLQDTDIHCDARKNMSTVPVRWPLCRGFLDKLVVPWRDLQPVGHLILQMVGLHHLHHLHQGNSKEQVPLCVHSHRVELSDRKMIEMKYVDGR